jgi:hypothetical protein
MSSRSLPTEEVRRGDPSQISVRFFEVEFMMDYGGHGIGELKFERRRVDSLGWLRYELTKFPNLPSEKRGPFSHFLLVFRS